jgi:hypothetical protein
LSGRGTINAETFLEAFQSKELRRFIVNHARRHSKNKDLQAEYIQEAWLAISCAPDGYPIDSLMTIASKAIYSAYWQENKERLIAQR